MVTAKDVYANRRREVLAVSVTLPWRRRGHAGVTEGPSHQGAFRFVTSKWSNPEAYEFAVEGLVLSRAILLYEGQPFPVQNPAREDGHWHLRVPTRAQPWWIASPTQRSVRDEVTAAISGVLLPEIGLHMSDEVLVREWKDITSGPATVQVNAARLGALAVSTENDSVYEAVTEYMLRGSLENPTSRWFDEHLRRLTEFRMAWTTHAR